MYAKRKEYFIVGSYESDPAAGRISNESPLGRAFLGRKCGAEFEATLPAGMKKFKVLEISCD
jgi:transcription elongation factor GreA